MHFETLTNEFLEFLNFYKYIHFIYIYIYVQIVWFMLHFVIVSTLNLFFSSFTIEKSHLIFVWFLRPQVQYLVDESTATGTCGVLVVDGER